VRVFAGREKAPSGTTILGTLARVGREGHEPPVWSITVLEKITRKRGGFLPLQRESFIIIPYVRAEIHP